MFPPPLLRMGGRGRFSFPLMCDETTHEWAQDASRRVVDIDPAAQRGAAGERGVGLDAEEEAGVGIIGAEVLIAVERGQRGLVGDLEELAGDDGWVEG